MSSRRIVHPTRGRVKIRAQYVKPHAREGVGSWLLSELSYGTESQRRYSKYGLGPNVPERVPAREGRWALFGGGWKREIIPARTIPARRSHSAYGRKIRTKIDPKGFLVYDSKRKQAKTVTRHTHWWG